VKSLVISLAIFLFIATCSKYSALCASASASVNILPAYLVDAPISDREPRVKADFFGDAFDWAIDNPEWSIPIGIIGAPVALATLPMVISYALFYQ
jgi:hypothetical protein